MTKLTIPNKILFGQKESSRGFLIFQDACEIKDREWKPLPILSKICAANPVHFKEEVKERLLV